MEPIPPAPPPAHLPEGTVSSCFFPLTSSLFQTINHRQPEIFLRCKVDLVICFQGNWEKIQIFLEAARQLVCSEGLCSLKETQMHQKHLVRFLVWGDSLEATRTDFQMGSRQGQPGLDTSTRGPLWGRHRSSRLSQGVPPRGATRASSPRGTRPPVPTISAGSTGQIPHVASSFLVRTHLLLQLFQKSPQGQPVKDTTKF